MTVVVGLRGALSRHLHVTVPADAAKSRSRAISSHRQQTCAGSKFRVAEDRDYLKKKKDLAYYVSQLYESR